jgi:hypothetical protein
LLYLATARHIVKPAGDVFVRACTAIELVRPEVVFITSGAKSIVAAPAIEDILTMVSVHMVVALLAIEDIFALPSAHPVVAISAIEDILAICSGYIVGAVSTIELVLARVATTHGAGCHPVEARPAVDDVAAYVEVRNRRTA